MFRNTQFTPTDASDYAIAGILTQKDENGLNRPIAFASRKLNETQRAWATIEKESYAALWSLQKYRNWIFGADITVHSDHNPLTYVTESAPKSARRWAFIGVQCKIQIQTWKS